MLTADGRDERLGRFAVKLAIVEGTDGDAT